MNNIHKWLTTTCSRLNEQRVMYDTRHLLRSQIQITPSISEFIQLRFEAELSPRNFGFLAPPNTNHMPHSVLHDDFNEPDLEHRIPDSSRNRTVGHFGVRLCVRSVLIYAVLVVVCLRTVCR